MASDELCTASFSATDNFNTVGSSGCHGLGCNWLHHILDMLQNPSVPKMPLKIDSISCHSSCELEEHSKMCNTSSSEPPKRLTRHWTRLFSIENMRCSNCLLFKRRHADTHVTSIPLNALLKSHALHLYRIYLPLAGDDVSFQILLHANHHLECYPINMMLFMQSINVKFYGISKDLWTMFITKTRKKN